MSFTALPVQTCLALNTCSPSVAYLYHSYFLITWWLLTSFGLQNSTNSSTIHWAATIPSPTSSEPQSSGGDSSKFVLLCLPFISPRLPFRIIQHLMIFYHSLILYIYIFPCLNHSVISVSLLDSHWYTCFQIYWSFFTGVQFAVKSIQYNYHFISFYFEMLTLQLLLFLFLGWDLLFGFSLCISFSFFFMYV